MSYQKQSFGMMDEGYFVSRGEILEWINSLLDLNITKIQQLGAGSIYCQIVDVIHPGKVALSKVNWKAKNDYEFIANLKLLQNAFDKVGVKRHVQVEKLSKAKYQDNLQFIQWLKRYYDLNCGDRGNGYNAAQKRGNAKIDLSFADKNIVIKQFNAKGQVVQQTKKIDPPAKKIQSYNHIGSTINTNKPNKKISPEKKNQSTTNWKDLYNAERSKTKNLQIQLSMVTQILQSEQTSQIKIAMIHETLLAQNQNTGENNAYQSNKMEVEEQYNI